MKLKTNLKLLYFNLLSFIVFVTSAAAQDLPGLTPGEVEARSETIVVEGVVEQEDVEDMQLHVLFVDIAIANGLQLSSEQYRMLNIARNLTVGSEILVIYTVDNLAPYIEDGGGFRTFISSEPQITNTSIVIDNQPPFFPDISDGVEMSEREIFPPDDIEPAGFFGISQVTFSGTDNAISAAAGYEYDFPSVNYPDFAPIYPPLPAPPFDTGARITSARDSVGITINPLPTDFGQEYRIFRERAWTRDSLITGRLLRTYNPNTPEPPSSGPTQKPGKGPNCNDDYQTNCGDEFTKIALGTCSGNVQISFLDPVRTRGFRLGNDVSLNSQTNLPDRKTVFGSASFTYGIEIIGPHSIGINDTSNWIVVDADGAELNFGPSDQSPSASAGIFSTLTQLQDGSFRITGASEPGMIHKAGNFDYHFNDLGKLNRIIDPAGNSQLLVYGNPGTTTSEVVIRVSDVSSNKVLDFNYNSDGLVESVVENGGGAINEYLYALLGEELRLVKVRVKGPQGVVLRETDISYDQNNKPQTVQRDSEPDSLVSFSYTEEFPNHYFAQISHDRGGPTIEYFVEPQVGDGVGGLDGFEYKHRISNPQGDFEEYFYDSENNLRKTVLPPPVGLSTPTTFEYDYDANYNMIEHRDSERTFTYTYNSLGLQTSFNNSIATWRNEYSGVDLTKQVVQEGTAGASRTILDVKYEDVNNPHHPTEITDGEGNSWSYTYNTFGQLLTVSPPALSQMGDVTYAYEEDFQSDEYGWLRSVLNGEGNLITFDSYSSLGDLTSVTTYSAVGVGDTTTYNYDALHRLTSVTNPDGTSSSVNYSGRDVSLSQDEAGTLLTYDFCAHCGSLNDLNGPLGKSLNMTRDYEGKLTAFNDGNSNITTWTYGSGDLLQFVDYPDGQFLGFQYDEDRLLQSKYISPSLEETYEYDLAGRLTKVDFYRANEEDQTITYRYDDVVETIEDEVGITTYEYFDNFLVKSVTYDYAKSNLADKQRLDYTYYSDNLIQSLTWVEIVLDPATQLETETVIAGWNYSYDSAGRLTQVTNSFAETTTCSYDGEGKMTETVFANGAKTHYEYNEDRNWVTKISHFKGSGNQNAFQIYDLEYDSGANTIGNLTKVTEKDLTEVTYQYDPLYRLVNEARVGTTPYSKSYTYDLAGNITEIDSVPFATYDVANKFDQLQGTNVGHNAAGSIKKIKAFSELPDLKMNWFTSQHLKRVETLDVNGDPTENYHRYKYDYFGRRGFRNGPNESRRHYIFAGNKLIGEVKPSGNKFIYTYGADGLVSFRRTSNGKSFFYHYGPQGETRALTNANGGVAVEYVYDAYGNEIAEIGNSKPNPFRYGGKYGYFTDELNHGGFILAGQRWYSPDLGRWLSRDPIRYEGGDNLYGYVLGNPIKFVDPNGLLPITPWDIADFGFFAEDLRTLYQDPSWTNFLYAAAGAGALAPGIPSVGAVKASMKVLGTCTDTGKTAKKLNTGPIKGYTKHGLNQAISREGKGVGTRHILDAAKNPKKIINNSKRGSNTYVGKNASVVLNNKGKVITTYGKPRIK